LYVPYELFSIYFSADYVKKMMSVLIPNDLLSSSLFLSLFYLSLSLSLALSRSLPIVVPFSAARFFFNELPIIESGGWT